MLIQYLLLSFILSLNLLKTIEPRFSSSLTMSNPPIHDSYATFACCFAERPTLGFTIVPTKGLCLTFNNFLNPQNAVLKIFKNMYRNELDPAFDGQRNILNPDIKEVGLSFLCGVFNFENYTANAYIVTCDFGTEIELHDLQLLQLINHQR
mgnify:CR=1 FL=1